MGLQLASLDIQGHEVDAADAQLPQSVTAIVDFCSRSEKHPIDDLMRLVCMCAGVNLQRQEASKP